MSFCQISAVVLDDKTDHESIIRILNEPLREKTNSLNIDQVRHNRAVQSQKKARSLKFWI